MSYVIAVDPGLTGAVAVMFEAGFVIEVFDMPVVDSGKGFVSRVVDATSLWHRIAAYASMVARPGDRAQGVRAVMERVNAMPAQGVSSMFSLGDSRGCTRGVLQTLGIPMIEVPPQTWKRDLDLVLPKPPKGMPKKERDQRKREAKARSRALAAKLFPAFAHLVAREKDHGRAEALLIGHWATRNV